VEEEDPKRYCFYDIIVMNDIIESSQILIRENVLFGKPNLSVRNRDENLMTSFHAIRALHRTTLLRHQVCVQVSAIAEAKPIHPQLQPHPTADQVERFVSMRPHRVME
jgi:hypothetical protein